LQKDPDSSKKLNRLSATPPVAVAADDDHPRHVSMEVVKPGSNPDHILAYSPSSVRNGLVKNSSAAYWLC
jgi:hypothetical protein